VALAESDGDIVERFTYNAYGEAQFRDPDFTIDANGSDYEWHYLYTTRHRDATTKLYFHRARYYHAQLGRFVSRDPIGYAAEDMNLYAYVGNSPPRRTDPLGLWWTGDTITGISYGPDVNMEPDLPEHQCAGTISCPPGFCKVVEEVVHRRVAWLDLAKKEDTIVGFYDGVLGGTPNV